MKKLIKTKSKQNQLNSMIQNFQEETQKIKQIIEKQRLENQNLKQENNRLKKNLFSLKNQTNSTSFKSIQNNKKTEMDENINFSNTKPTLDKYKTPPNSLIRKTYRINSSKPINFLNTSVRKFQIIPTNLNQQPQSKTNLETSQTVSGLKKQIKKLEMELEQKKMRIKVFEEKEKHQSMKKYPSRTIFSNKKNNSKKLNQFKKENSRLKDEIINQNKEIEEMKLLVIKINDLNQVLKNSLNNFKSKVFDLEKKLEKSNQNQNQIENQIENQNQNQNQIEQINKDLQQKIIDYQNLKIELEESLKIKDDEIFNLKQSNFDQKLDIRDLQTKIEKSHQNIFDLAEEIKKLQRENVNLIPLKETVEDLQGQLLKSQKSNKNLNYQISNLQKKQEEILQENEKLHKNLTHFDQENQKIQEEKNDLESKLINYQETNENLTNLNENLQLNVSQLKIDIEKIKNENIEIENMKNEWKNQSDDLIDEKEDLKNYIFELEKSLQELIEFKLNNEKEI
ncbi:ctcl tumor antigen hd-cl-01 [Anaeramoeba ignava]|uniref:Ctcl tumor antigen hd-cl-01 n=1 Tax=Anaeramoeba ignava TaxID=1746090 RepID=A0A9Q0LRR0_ANAIG|nr:ctcl tumor antigen hd-cl-01 [Anaeramoeba ignava]